MKVVLRGLPLRVAQRSNEHYATIRRELAFVDAAADPDATPAKLLTLSARLGAKYSNMNAAQQERAVVVAASGGETIDLEYDVAPEMADDAEQLFALFEEVDAFCTTGDLVSLVTPPDVRAFRRWVYEQFCSQIRDSAAPVAWEPPLPAAEPPAAEPPPAEAPRAGRIAVAEDLDLEGAAHLRNGVAEQVERGVTDLELDMASCGFVDSTGISMLLTARARLMALGGSLTLVNVSDEITRTLTYAGVHDMLISR